MKKRIALFVGVVVGLASLAPSGWARQGGITLLRDAETEGIIRQFSAPLFEAAGLDPQSVAVHLVNDSGLNAFVAGGQRIFINTGLLLRAETPNQLIGVIAHETGHITGGHLARTQDALRSASAQAIIAFVLGAAAAVAGSPEGGSAIIAGGQHIAGRSLLQYTRTQESAADQAAVTLLDRTGQSARGLLEFLHILGDQEALLVGRQDPYVRTHPVSGERIAALEARVAQSQYSNIPDSAESIALFKRMQAKLLGYLEPAQALRKFEGDDSLPARYARAVAYFRTLEIERSLAEFDRLIAEHPKDPYFYELKAQVLFENGKIAEALVPAEAAMRAAPREPLLRFALAQVQIATEDPALNRQAVEHLEEVVRYDPGYSAAWQQLAIAYGRDGDLGMSALASAERFLLQGNKRDARGQAERAARLLPEGSPGWLRAQDLINAAKRED